MTSSSWPELFTQPSQDAAFRELKKIRNLHPDPEEARRYLCGIGLAAWAIAHLERAPAGFGYGMVAIELALGQPADPDSLTALADELFPPMEA